MYTAIVLDTPSRMKLLGFDFTFDKEFFESRGWEVIAHHSTLNMGRLDESLNPKDCLGQRVEMRATHIGVLENVCAVRVEYELNSANEVKHVTLAVDRKKGGKPFHSNKIKNWSPLTKELVLSGVVEEVE